MSSKRSTPVTLRFRPPKRTKAPSNEGVKLQAYMKMAEAISLLSPDIHTKVGAVLIKGVTPIASAYNGFVSGAPDEHLPKTKPEKHLYMVHAEANLVSHCARNGIATEGCTLVCTLSPCPTCLKLLYQSGIRRAIVRDLCKFHEAMLKAEDIGMTVLSMPSGFYDVRYWARTTPLPTHSPTSERLITDLASLDAWLKKKGGSK